MEKVAILMATYNGEQFIEKQIESILEQSYDNFTLYIRDDGSTDSTLDIIERFKLKDKRIVLINHRDDTPGAYVNFLHLLNYMKFSESYDFYFLADQDDIWKKDKIKKMISFLKTRREPCLVYSNMSIIDQNDQVLREVYHVENELSRFNKYFLFFNYNSFIWGCTTCFNRALFDLLPILDIKSDYKYLKNFSHDKYLSEVAVQFGSIIYLDEPLIEYRRHEKNVSDFEFKSSSIGKHFFEEKSKEYAELFNQTLYFVKLFKNREEVAENLSLIEEIILRGGLNAVFKLNKLGIRRKSLGKTLLLYCLVFLKKYQEYLFNFNED